MKYIAKIFSVGFGRCQTEADVLRSKVLYETTTKKLFPIFFLSSKTIVSYYRYQRSMRTRCTTISIKRRPCRFRCRLTAEFIFQLESFHFHIDSAFGLIVLNIWCSSINNSYQKRRRTRSLKFIYVSLNILETGRETTIFCSYLIGDGSWCRWVFWSIKNTLCWCIDLLSQYC